MEKRRSKGRVARFFGRFKDSLKTATLFCSLALASCVFESEGIQRPDVQDGRADTVAVDSRKDAGKDSIDGMHDMITPDVLSPDSGPWWNKNWKYCRQITITGNAPAGYAHSVFLDPASPISFNHSHANTDLSDLRFIEGVCNSVNAGKTALPAWVENVDPIKGSKVWFKTQTANISTIAMYYGNSAAANIFDGDKVFVLFDSFDGASLDTSKWVCNGTCNVAGGLLTFADTSGTYPYVKSVKLFGTSYVFNSRAAFGGTSAVNTSDAYVGFSDPKVTAAEYMLWMYDGPTVKYAAQFDGSSPYTTSAETATDNNFHIWRIDRNAADADYYYDGTLIHNLTQSYPTGTYPVILHTNHTGLTLNVDWVFVRPKVSPEPTYAVGPEKTQ